MAEAPVKVLLVASTGRSGSTILDRLVGAADGCCSTGELMQIWDRGFRQNLLCGCGQPLRECEFWKRVAVDAFGALDDLPLEAILALHPLYSRTRGLPGRALRRVLGSLGSPEWQTYSAALSALYRSIRRVSGCRVVVDSSKSFAYALTLAQLPDIDLRVVHLIRDSRAVAYSWQRKRRDPSFHEKERFLSRFSPTRIAAGWNTINASLDVLNALKRLDCLRVRYEDLIRRPDRELDRIWRHLGEEEPAESALDGKTLPPGTAHTVSGNPMRFKQGGIVLELDLEWQRQMPGRQHFLVSALTGPLLLRYGYRLRSGAVRQDSRESSVS